MARRFEDKVRIIGISGLDNVQAMKTFVARHRLEHLDHIADETGDTWRALGNTHHPAWWFVDDDGTVEKVIGELDAEQLTEKLEGLAAR